MLNINEEQRLFFFVAEKAYMFTVANMLEIARKNNMLRNAKDIDT